MREKSIEREPMRDRSRKKTLYTHKQTEGGESARLRNTSEKVAEGRAPLLKVPVAAPAEDDTCGRIDCSKVGLQWHQK